MIQHYFLKSHSLDRAVLKNILSLEFVARTRLFRCLMKWTSEMLQNSPYCSVEQTKICTFHFVLKCPVLTLDILIIEVKLARYENRKNNFEFWYNNIWQFWNFSSGHFIEHRPLIFKECKVFFFSIQTAHYVRRFRHMADMIIAIVLLSLKKWSVVIYEKNLDFIEERSDWRIFSCLFWLFGVHFFLFQVLLLLLLVGWLQKNP